VKKISARVRKPGTVKYGERVWDKTYRRWGVWAPARDGVRELFVAEPPAWKHLQYLVVTTNAYDNGTDGDFGDFRKGDLVLFLGEIPKCGEHIAVINTRGKVCFMYHYEDFRAARWGEY